MYERGLIERRLATRRRGSINVVQAENAVHAVLYLVRVFVNGSARIRMRQREYLGRRVIVVYVGAIAVLFRFVVMILNVSGAETRVLNTSAKEAYKVNTRQEDSIGRRRMIGRGVLSASVIEEEVNQVWMEQVQWIHVIDSIGDMHVLGQVLYTYGIYYVIRAGRVLLVGILGAIVLTLQTGHRGRQRTWKRQQVSEQRSRDAENAVLRVNKSL